MHEHAVICGCTDESCVWQDGKTWDVIRLDETLDRTIVHRALAPNEAFIQANIRQEQLNPSAPIVYIVCAPDGVISFEEA